MRILHLTRDLAPRINGGISVAVAGLARAQARRDHEVAAVSFDGYRPRRRAAAHEPARAEYLGPISVLRISAPDQLEGARAFAEAHAPDIVHVHHAMLWAVGAELRRHTGAPAVLTAHVAQAAQDRLRGLAEPTASARAEAEAVAAADLVHAPSRAAAAALPPDAGALVAPLGVDDTELARASAAAGPPANGPVLFAGRFADIGGMAELIAAIPRILERAPDRRVVIAGGCPDSPRADRRWRRRLERELPIAAHERVELTGWLTPERLSALYARAAALVVPSRFETFGLVAVEGMLHGAPIAATSGGALAEILDHETTALLSPPGDVAALADHVARLVLNPEHARELAARAARTARDRYLWDHVIEDLLAGYDAITARSSG